MSSTQSLSKKKPNAPPVKVPIVLPRVTFAVSSGVSYEEPALSMPIGSRDIRLDLQEGQQTFTSTEFRLGTVIAAGSRALLGQLSFRYTYDAKHKVITVCDTDFPSADGMRLITKPKGTQETAVEHAAPGCGFAADDVHRNATWNYHSQLMPGAHKLIRDIVRGANDSLLSALRGHPDLNVKVRTKLAPLPLDLYPRLCSVFRDDEFLELYDEDKAAAGNYDAADVVRIVDSTIGGKLSLANSQNFANVIGSTRDPYPKSYNSWIQVWMSAWSVATKPTWCSSTGYPVGFACNPSFIYGGHVVLGTTAMKVANGSNSVMIIPICSNHNNNNTIYMKPMVNNEAVYLNNYNN